MIKETHTVITGASSGIGKAIAKQCAARKRNLILISLPEENLAYLGDQISSKYEVNVHCYESDLTEDGAIKDFFDWCKHGNFEIDMLVNNAGIGQQGKFIESDHPHTLSMMSLNMDVVTSMTWSALPYLRRHEKSHILNVGSIISYMSVPYKALYAATKSFVLTFSNALHYELKGIPIHVSCLCPGPTLTTKKRAQQLREVGWMANVLVKTPEEVAKKALDGLEKGKRTIIPGLANKMLVGLGKYLPTDLQLRIANSVFANSEFNSQTHDEKSEETNISVEAE